MSIMDSYTISKTQLLGMLISQRLTAAAEEIFKAVERTIEEYEEKVNKSNVELDRQRKLLDIILNPRIKLHRQDLQHSEQEKTLDRYCEEKNTSLGLPDSVVPQQVKVPVGKSQEELRLQVWEETDTKDTVFTVTCDLLQQHHEQERSPSLALKGPESPQRESNLWTGQGERQLPELEEADIFPVTPEPYGGGRGEPQSPGEPESPREFQPRSEIKTEDGDGHNDWRQDSITLTSTRSQPLGRGPGSADRPDGGSDSLTPDPHKDTAGSCPVCGLPCSSDSALLRHVQTHALTTEPRVCGNVVESPDGSMQHLPSHRERTLNSCGSCSPMRRMIPNSLKSNKTESLNTKKKATEEEAVLEGKYIVCSVCGKCLSSESDVSEHMRTHTAKELLCCDVCGSRFQSHLRLRIHRRVHTEEKPYRCDLCGRSFRVKKYLRLHRYTHTEERPFRCSVCGMGFKQPTTLKNHKAVHTVEKPHRCDVCGMAFGLRKILVGHLKSRKHLNAVRESVFSPVG